MTSPNKTSVMAALERVGAQGATSERLSQMSGVPLEKTRRIVGNGVLAGKVNAAMPAFTNPQIYVLSRHLKAFKAAHDAAPPAQQKPSPPKAKAKPSAQGKPASKPAPVAAPKAPKEPRHCSSTTPVMQQSYLPRMECARPGAEAHAAIPSRRGADLVAHRPPMHMCSALRGGA